MYVGGSEALGGRRPGGKLCLRLRYCGVQEQFEHGDGEAGARQAMRVLVCGGRYFQNVVRLWRVLDAFHAKHTIAGVIEGGSDAVAGEYYGADYWARMWAKAHGIPSMTEFADWDQFGRWAGPKRNKEMIDKYSPEAVIAFPGGAGTANMIKQARTAGIDVHEVADKD
jgi:YspA, cpYpsA-related SLOG family